MLGTPCIFAQAEITQIVREADLDNRTPPLGPPALALRLRGAGKRTVLAVAVLVGTALLTGVGLLLA